ALYQDDSWACELASRVSALVNEEVPNISEWLVSPGDAGILHDYLEEGGHFTVHDLLRDPWQRERTLKGIVLLIRRRNDRTLLPGPDTPLKAGDRLLICGDRAAFRRMHWTVSHRHTLDYVRTGEDRAQSWIWRKLARRNRQPR
ncbi:MAG: TrkA C-terminal domain-containing protein, partial [Sedimenticolaceae bacterium]